MREQQAMLVLKGTSAVELFDVCRGLDGELCLVMELLKGNCTRQGFKRRTLHSRRQTKGANLADQPTHNRIDPG